MAFNPPSLIYSNLTSGQSGDKQVEILKHSTKYDYLCFAETFGALFPLGLETNKVKTHEVENCVRQKDSTHGGVATFVRAKTVKYETLQDKKEDTMYELVVSVVEDASYFPGHQHLIVINVYFNLSTKTNEEECSNYFYKDLSRLLDRLKSPYPNPAIIIVGDFNKWFDGKKLCRTHNLRQVVEFETFYSQEQLEGEEKAERKQFRSKLDYVYTNVEQYYDVVALPPIDTIPHQSGHLSIGLIPKSLDENGAPMERQVTDAMIEENEEKIRKRLIIREGMKIVGTKRVCHYCYKIFTRKDNLETHIRLHMGSKPYNCTECNASFVQATNLRLHMHKHGADRQFECHICDGKFLTASNLRQHLETHEEHAALPCPHCGKMFRTRQSLSMHVLTHTTYKHLCKVCGKTFPRADRLKVHLDGHNNIKPYECSFCSKTFKQKTHLQKHLKVLHV